MLHHDDDENESTTDFGEPSTEANRREESSEEHRDGDTESGSDHDNDPNMTTNSEFESGDDSDVDTASESDESPSSDEKSSASSNKPNQINRSRTPNIVIIGGTGCGKSSIGKHLAKILGFGIYDLDEVIEDHAKKSIDEIFTEHGNEGFRDYETKILESISGIMNHVIVLGAGALEREKNRVMIKKLGPLVWVSAPTSEVVQRIAMSHDEISRRPLLKDAVNIENKQERIHFLSGKIDELHLQREDQYALADLKVVNSYGGVEIGAWSIKTKLIKWSQSPEQSP